MFCPANPTCRRVSRGTTVGFRDKKEQRSSNPLTPTVDKLTRCKWSLRSNEDKVSFSSFSQLLDTLQLLFGLCALPAERRVSHKVGNELLNTAEHVAAKKN